MAGGIGVDYGVVHTMAEGKRKGDAAIFSSLHVHIPPTEPKSEALRRSVVHGSPYGYTPGKNARRAGWGLEHTLRPGGRPTKVEQRRC
jgi:hypothetical protein